MLTILSFFVNDKAFINDFSSCSILCSFGDIARITGYSSKLKSSSKSLAEAFETFDLIECSLFVF
jgi:hypothetical protein